MLTGSEWRTGLPDVTSLMLIGGVPALALAVVIIVVMVTRTRMKRRRRHAGNKRIVLSSWFIFLLSTNVIRECPNEVTFCIGFSCQLHDFAAAPLRSVHFPSPDQQSGIHCLIICAIQLLTPN